MRTELITILVVAVAWAAGSANAETLKVRVSFGHRAIKNAAFPVRMVAGSAGLRVSAMQGVGLEADDSVGDRAVLHAGAGDVDALDVEVTWTKPTKERRNVHSIWQYLLADGGRADGGILLTPSSSAFCHKPGTLPNQSYQDCFYWTDVRFTPGGGSSAGLTLVEGKATGKANDDADYELGTRFKSTKPGQVTALRVWHPVGGPRRYTLRLWNSAGAELGSATAAAPDTAGWVEAELSSPIPTAADTPYMVSYSVAKGEAYQGTPNLLAFPLSNGPLTTDVTLQSATGQVARLKDDQALIPDAPVLTVELAEDGTRGFSVGLEQLLRHKAMWLPAHDAFVTLADSPVDFDKHVGSLKGERTLDRVKHEPEASLAEWTGKWEDFGNPKQWDKPWQTSWLGTQGHLTGFVARHGSLYKFGVDRWASVRPDHASPHKFRFDPLWLGLEWTGQRIVDGLPILVTSYEREGQRCEVEQILEPLHDVPTKKRGEIASVLLNKFCFSGAPGPLRFGFRLATENKERHPELRDVGGHWCVVDRETGNVWLMVEPGPGLKLKARKPIADEKDPRVEFDAVGELAAGETREIVVKLASPTVPVAEVAALAMLDFAKARAATVKYWEGWLAQGAQFEVPEKTVNDLFRANLWHALMLPRFRTGENGEPRIDLPYSNFAYGQLNADWPINQAVYVDYMIHGLRGHYAVANEEFAAMYHTQQKPDGRVGGFADWGVYSPGMLYAIAQNFLLSGDRASFERLLPASLKAMDWCLGQVAKGQENKEAPGLIVAPLNDLTHASRAWGFPNGYFVAGLDIFARALGTYGHPRAAEVAAVAKKMHADVTAAFARGSVKSPVVQLADGTWSNYVPCDAMTPRRLFEEWYPTDVDAGVTHMARLAAIDPRGWLATAMLHDHEDNLYLNQWGAANEPVYNMQATAYLYRDEPEAVIRAFYSMMACAFSHHQLTPLEHRWAWGQYYMPPSTDGAWFELYRNMLLNELRGDGTLFIGQAVPRAWFADGKRIEVKQAPTYYGPLSFTTESRVADNEIRTTTELSDRKPPAILLVRFRHPLKKPMTAVTVNGEEWKDFDPKNEWVRIVEPKAGRLVIVAKYPENRK